MTKLKNSNYDNSKTQIVTKPKNSNCDETQNHKLWQNSKTLKTQTQIFTKLKLDCDCSNSDGSDSCGSDCSNSDIF